MSCPLAASRQAQLVYVHSLAQGSPAEDIRKEQLGLAKAWHVPLRPFVLHCAGLQKLGVSVNALRSHFTTLSSSLSTLRECVTRF
jgi:hypothetical protein